MTGLIVFLVIFGGILAWFFFSIRRVGPTEMAVRVMFGKPIGYCPSGLYFVPRLPGCYLIKVSTKQYKVEVQTVEAYTKRGKYGEIEYGSQPVKIDPTVYLYFPRDRRLIDVVKAGIPTTEEGLSSHLNNAVQEAVRIAVGQFIWKTITQQVNKVRDMADAAFKDPKSPLKSAGFSNDDFHLIVEKVEVPQRLKELMSQPDEERFKAEAAKHSADAQVRGTIGLKIKMLAEAFGKTPEEVRQDIDSDPKFKKKIDETSTDLIERIIALEKGALIDIRSNNSLLDAVALFKKISGGGSPQQPGEKERKFSQEEDRKFFDDLAKKSKARKQKRGSY